MESGSDRCMGTDGDDSGGLYFYKGMIITNISNEERKDFSKFITDYLAYFPCVKI